MFFDSKTTDTYRRFCTIFFLATSFSLVCKIALAQEASRLLSGEFKNKQKIASVSSSEVTHGEKFKKSAALKRTLKQIVKEYNLVGIIAGVADKEGFILLESQGVRKVGFSEQMKTNNLVHLGSCTKAMTCVMLATLVEEKKLSWESKLIDIFPELKDAIDTSYYDLSLWELVTHRSGVSANAKNWRAFTNLKIKTRRLKLLEVNLKEKSLRKRGSYLYSNLGYLIAGCMAEKVTGKSWETLMRERVFIKLEMKEAGFGIVGKKNEIEQPWGHYLAEKKWVAIQADNAAALGPAGTVHCSFADWRKFAALWLPGYKKKIISPKMLKRLAYPTTGTYAAGWNVVERDWAKGNAMTHNGSNTMWNATVWIAPQTGKLYFVAVNSSDKKSSLACDRTIRELIKTKRE